MLGLGLGLSLGGSGALDAPGFPATLSLTGWWRASYAGSPWTGYASLGASGSRSLTNGATPPGTGTAVNGKTPADFNGTTQYLSAGGTWSDYYTASVYSGWMLVKIDAVDTNNADLTLNDCLVSCSTSAWHGVCLKSGGTVHAFSYDTGSGLNSGPSTTFTIGSWQLVQWKREGGSLKIRVNGGAWQTSVRTNLSASYASEGVRVGFNAQNNSYIDGLVLDVGFANTALSDADFDSILSYARTRYALALT